MIDLHHFRYSTKNKTYGTSTTRTNRSPGKFTETLLRHVGLVRLNDATSWIVFYWLTPELIALPSVVVVYVVCRRLTLENKPEDGEPLCRRESAPPSPKVIFLFNGWSQMTEERV